MLKTQRSARAVPFWAHASFYWCASRLMGSVLWLFSRWQVQGLQYVPRRGPVLMVANHLHNADPPLLAASIPSRRIRFMAKSELYDDWRTDLPLRLFGAFPVRRFEADLAALRTAQELLKAGHVVGMLPEGHRNRTGTGMQAAQPGAGLIALRAGAPVLPVAITGTEQIRGLGVLLKRPLITVTIGEPFVIPHTGRIDRGAVQSATDRIMRSIAALLPPAYRGVWNDSPARPDCRVE